MVQALRCQSFLQNSTISPKWRPNFMIFAENETGMSDKRTHSCAARKRTPNGCCSILVIDALLQASAITDEGQISARRGERHYQLRGCTRSRAVLFLCLSLWFVSSNSRRSSAAARKSLDYTMAFSSNHDTIALTGISEYAYDLEMPRELPQF